MRITETSDVWWKTAVIYCLDVETYLDWNDDGSGDFPGLAQRLDYLSSLGRDLPVADAVLSDARTATTATTSSTSTASTRGSAPSATWSR